MNVKIKYGLFFAGGTLVGAVGTFFGCKQFFAKEMDAKITEEVAKSRERCNELNKQLAEKNETLKKQLGEALDEKEKILNSIDIKETKKLIEENGYSAEEDDEKVVNKKYQNKNKKNKNKEIIDYKNKTVTAPYVIRPEEYGQGIAASDDYTLVNLTYYSIDDEIYFDARDEKMENYKEYLIPNLMEHFGEFEEGKLYVRNEILKTDYDIVLNSTDSHY